MNRAIENGSGMNKCINGRASLRKPYTPSCFRGNTALLGAKRALFEDPAKWDAIAARVEHSALNEDASFHDVYAEEMVFPK